MSGEERKFKRRRIVPLSSTCKRERELAASNTSIVAGIAAIGVAVNSLIGVTVREGRGVSVLAEVLVGAGIMMLSSPLILVLQVLLLVRSNWRWRRVWDCRASPPILRA